MATRIFITTLASAMLAACAPEGEPDVMSDSAEVSATEMLPAPDSLDGEWRVAGIDGQPLEEPYGIALSADEEEIWWEPRCAGMIRGYLIVGNAITTGPRVTDPPLATDMPPPVCTIGLPPRLIDVVRALEAADTIETTAENGVRLSGGGHSLTLFSQ